MKVTLIVGTVKGGFRFTSDDRRTWRMEEPLFKGWKVTTSARSPDGRSCSTPRRFPSMGARPTRASSSAFAIAPTIREWCCRQRTESFRIRSLSEYSMLRASTAPDRCSK